MRIYHKNGRKTEGGRAGIFISLVGKSPEIDDRRDIPTGAYQVGINLKSIGSEEGRGIYEYIYTGIYISKKN